MRVIDPQPLVWREVEYYGITLQIPYDHKYIAVDNAGWLYSYATAPEQGTTMWMGADFMDICRVDLEGTDWTTTLEQV